MADKYILNDKGEPIEENDLMKWARWFETGDRKVAMSEINGMTVSTVFLGLNHNFGEGEPILWETMLFKDGDEQNCERCGGNLVNALAMHARVEAQCR